MARNQVVSGGTGSYGWAGPFVDGNDNVYVTENCNVHKASDPLGGSWTEQTSPSPPSFGAPQSAWWQESDTLYGVGWYGALGVYRHFRFTTSDHSTTPDEWTATADDVETPANAPSTAACYIALRSDGDRIVLYNGDTDKIMGVDYDRCDYARWEGTSWTAGINVAGDGLEEYYNALGIGRGENDTTWLYYAAVSGDANYSKDLSSSNTLGSAITVVSSAANYDRVRNSPVIAYYDDGGVEVMSYSHRPGAVISSRQTRDGTLQSALNTSLLSTATYPFNVVDGTDLYVVARSTSDDIYYCKSADGAAHETEVLVSTATLPTSLSANVIDHGGGKVLAVVYDDTDIYYDEISIAAAVEPYLPYYGWHNRMQSTLLRM